MDEAIMRYGEAVQHEIVHSKEYYLFNQNGFNILAHFTEGKTDVIAYGKESGEQLGVECAFMPAARESLPERRPSFFKSKVREWWDAILAAPSDEEPVIDIVD
jgi:hypothetical protein